MRRIAAFSLLLIVLPGCGTLTVKRVYVYPETKPVVTLENRRHKTWFKDMAWSYRWNGGYPGNMK